MIPTKQLFLFFLLLILAMPVKICHAQIETETIQQDDTDNKDKKDKKREKKILEMNEKFIFSLSINLVNIALIIGLLYYPNYRKLDYIFTLIIFNLVIFLLTFVLKYVKLSVGAAFGLFAVFSMLRYRTEGISMKDLTYLFVFIAMGLLSAIQLEFYELGIIHGIIFISIFILDGNLIFKRELQKSIQYENIELIKPGKHPELIEDLRKRTGLNIHRIVIGKIDFLKDSATVKAFYYE